MSLDNIMSRRCHIALPILIFFAIGVLSSLENFQVGSYPGRKQEEVVRSSTTARAESDGRDNVVRVLFGASGSDSGFVSELEVALKSILLNAPMDRNMEVHYLADDEASSAILKVLGRIRLKHWKLRNKLTITIHNTQSYIANWTETIDDVWKHVNGTKNHFRHSVAAYFRLFAHQVLPKSVKHVIYMDSDVVILANLQEVWRHVDSSNEKVFQWGEAGQCSGFLVLNVQNLRKMWDLVPTLDIDAGAGTNGDQRIMRTFNETYPKLVGTLPRQWDISVKNGFHQNRSLPFDRATPQEVRNDLESAGMLHFNGGGESSNAYFEKRVVAQYNDTFGLAKFYIHMPWSWARFMAESNRRDDMFYLPTIKSL